MLKNKSGYQKIDAVHFLPSMFTILATQWKKSNYQLKDCLVSPETVLKYGYRFQSIKTKTEWKHL